MRLTQFCHVVQQEEFRAKQGGGAAGEANEGDISTIPPNGLDGATNDISKDDRRGERTSRRGGTHSRARMKRSICLCNLDWHRSQTRTNYCSQNAIIARIICTRILPGCDYLYFFCLDYVRRRCGKRPPCCLDAKHGSPWLAISARRVTSVVRPWIILAHHWYSIW